MINLFSRPASKQALVFVHLPKTAGTTFSDILVRYYAKPAVFTLRGQQLEQDIARFKQLSSRKRRGIQLLMGHSADRLSSLLPQPACITFMRDAVAHTCSSFQYISQTEHNRYHGEVKQLQGITQFLQWQVEAGFDNQQCRYLAGIDVRTDPDNKKIDMQTNGQFYYQQAIDKLNSFAHVFLTEHFDEALLILQQALAWPSPPYYKKLNQSQSQPQHSISCDTEQAIRHTQQWDEKLYQHAKTLFMASKKQYPGDLANELLTFRLHNEALS